VPQSPQLTAPRRVPHCPACGYSLEGLAESREQGKCPECGEGYTAAGLAYSECPSDLRVSFLMLWPLGVAVLAGMTSLVRPTAMVVAIAGVAVWMVVTPVVAQIMLRKHVPPTLRPAGFIRQAKYFGMLTRIVVTGYLVIMFAAMLGAAVLIGILVVGVVRVLL